jgi:hypothetical protein
MENISKHDSKSAEPNFVDTPTPNTDVDVESPEKAGDLAQNGPKVSGAVVRDPVHPVAGAVADAGTPQGQTSPAAELAQAEPHPTKPAPAVPTAAV